MISFKSPAQVAEKYRDMFNKDCPAKSTLYFLRDLLLETGSVIKHRPRSGRPVTASGDDKVEETRQLITNDPTLSIDDIADELHCLQMEVLLTFYMKNYIPILTSLLVRKNCTMATMTEDCSSVKL